MQVGLIISTYRSPAMLSLVLQSVAGQRVRPDQVVVVEDGESDETRSVVEAAGSSVRNLTYLGQEDRGFRLARVRNLGILHSNVDFIVFVDGDMLLHERFIADHRAFAKPGCFSQGGRQQLSSVLSESLLEAGRLPGGFERFGFGRDPKNKSILGGIRLPGLNRLLSREYDRPRKTVGCNQGFFRKDLVSVNGFDNAFTGWGEEDYNLVQRLLAGGVRERLVRCAAVAWHLYHPQRERQNTRGSEVPPVRAANGLHELAQELGRPVEW